MAVVVFIESFEGEIKKAGYELASYGRAISDAKKVELIAVGFNLVDTKSLSNYGVDKLYNIDTKEDLYFNIERFSSSIASVVKKENASIVIVSGSADGRYLGPILSVKVDAAYISNVVEIPSEYKPLKVKRSCFTNKAFNLTQSSKHLNVLSLSSNSYGLKEKISTIKVLSEDFANSSSTLKVSSVDKASDKVSIADADIVVSGGRGLKGPENWYLIEDLAEVLGAATACSKPVSDMGWRSNSEHVGQTGKPVASNLYIAVGVSGAIQHLAGINSSKVKVVINTDPEAPFFKAADYGIIGDAFEVVPKLTEKLKARKL